MVEKFLYNRAVVLFPGSAVKLRVFFFPTLMCSLSLEAKVTHLTFLHWERKHYNLLA